MPQVRRGEEEQALGLDVADRSRRLIVEAMGEGAATIDADGVILFANGRLAELCGRAANQITGQKLQSLFAAEDAEELEFMIRMTGKRAGTANFQLLGPGGSLTPVRLAVRAMDATGPPALVAVMSELKEVFAAQAAADALNHEVKRATKARSDALSALALMSAVSRAVAGAADEQELLGAACRAAVEVGGYALVWVGYPDETETIQPMAFVGPRGDALAQERISTWEKFERKFSPSGEAARSGKPVITRDTSSDANLESWRSLASKSGFRSAVTLPLTADSQKLGVLTVCSAQPDAFAEEELELLRDCTATLAFGITTLRVRATAGAASPATLPLTAMAAPAQEAAEAAAGQLGARLSATTDGFWRMDEQGRLLDVNEAYCRTSGFSREELLQLTLAQLGAADPPEDPTAPLDAAKAAGFHRFLRRHRTKDGGVIGLELTLFHLPDAGQFLVFTRQPPEAAAAGTQAPVPAAEAALLEASPEPLLVIGPDRRITGANEPARLMFGVARDQLISQDFADGFTDPAAAQAGFAAILEKGLVRELALTLKGEGPGRDVLCNATVVHAPDGAPARVIATVRNAAEARLAESELRLRGEQLEQTIRTKTVELDAASKDLEALAYSVSHDLRAHLRSVDGYSRILLEDYGAKLDAEAQRELNIIREGAQKMSQMIEQILTFSRAGRLALKSEPLDMEAMARAVLDELQPQLAGRTVKLEVGRLAQAFGDRGLVRRVWTTLLSAAVSSTAGKPETHIEVGCTPGDAETIYFVRDNGMGFDMAQIDQLFAMASRQVVDFPGAGMNLAIARRIVGRHGGRVWAEGRPGEGSSFYFSLPLPEGGATAS